LDDSDLERPALASRWPQFAEAVAAHEARHVQIAKEEAESLRVRIADIGGNKSGCQALSAQVADAWSRGVEREKEAQLKFHADEHAGLEPARADLNNRLSSYRTQIDTLKSQIDAMDAELSRLRAKADGFKAITDDIKRRYPSQSLPEPEFSRYNTAVDSYNATLDSYNVLAAQERTVVEAHNKAVAESNAVAEELAWLG
jgi:chromosome segregation ATPase